MDDSTLKAAIGESVLAIMAKGIVQVFIAEKSCWVEPAGGGVGQLVWCSYIDGAQFMKVQRYKRK